MVMARPSKPVSATLRAYQVGFGDCFLLTFHYSRTPGENDRHLLIDFGSTGLPESARGSDQLLRIARDIKAVCEGKLAGVVATHRHRDHISGFATNKRGTGPGDIIASCGPQRVIQPWTEDPKATPNARTTIQRLAPNTSFIASLDALHLVSEATLRETNRLGPALRKDLRDELRFLGEDNLKNLSAVENLMRMGQGGKARYVNYGADSGLEKVLPGVKVTVLGPPDLEQSDAIRKQRARDRNEFWHLQARTGSLLQTSTPDVFPGAEVYGGSRPPLHCRWLIRKMKNLRGEQLLSLVRALDQQMNNTSVILLFEIGKKKLLFSGDAQIENWSFALSKRRNQELLKTVNLYKVGHHGSLNATPKKSLWDRFENRSPDPSPHRLQTVVSTMAGKHGKPDRKTEVPRHTLIAALNRDSQLITTEALMGDDLAQIVKIDLR